jgi:hypothetical protein
LVARRLVRASSFFFPADYGPTYCLLPVPNLNFNTDGALQGYQLCKNGVCRSAAIGAVCVCNPDWTGALCDTRETAPAGSASSAFA